MNRTFSASGPRRRRSLSQPVVVVREETMSSVAGTDESSVIPEPPSFSQVEAAAERKARRFQELNYALAVASQKQKESQPSQRSSTASLKKQNVGNILKDGRSANVTDYINVAVDSKRELSPPDTPQMSENDIRKKARKMFAGTTRFSDIVPRPDASTKGKNSKKTGSLIPRAPMHPGLLKPLLSKKKPVPSVTKRKSEEEAKASGKKTRSTEESQPTSARNYSNAKEADDVENRDVDIDVQGGGSEGESDENGDADNEAGEGVREEIEEMEADQMQRAEPEVNQEADDDKEEEEGTEADDESSEPEEVEDVDREVDSGKGKKNYEQEKQKSDSETDVEGQRGENQFEDNNNQQGDVRTNDRNMAPTITSTPFPRQQQNRFQEPIESLNLSPIASSNGGQLSITNHFGNTFSKSVQGPRRSAGNLKPVAIFPEPLANETVTLDKYSSIRKTMSHVSSNQETSATQTKRQHSSSAPVPPKTTAASPKRSSKVNNSKSMDQVESNLSKSAKLPGRHSAVVASASQASTSAITNEIKKATADPNRKSDLKRKITADRDDNQVSLSKKSTGPPVEETRHQTIEDEDDDVFQEEIQKPAGKKAAAPGKKRRAAGKKRGAVGKKQAPIAKKRSPVGKKQAAAGKKQEVVGKKQAAVDEEQAAVDEEQAADDEEQAADDEEQAADDEEQAAINEEQVADDEPPTKKRQATSIEVKRVSQPQDTRRKSLVVASQPAVSPRGPALPIPGTPTTRISMQRSRSSQYPLSPLPPRILPLLGSQNSRISVQREILPQPSSSQQPVAPASSSQQPIRTKRQSIFHRSRIDTQSKANVAANRKKKETKSSSQGRYVGSDVFGNYSMLSSYKVTEIVKEVRPKEKKLLKSSADMSLLTLRVNHYLEDFFTILCQGTNQPYGFVTFQQLRSLLVQQQLIPSDTTTDGLLNLMKENMSKEDWKRSEGILYPARHSKREDTDDYYN